jgi:myo-inositol-1(or 4)-monophosphatase
MLDKIRQVLYQAVYESGDILLRHFGAVHNIEYKTTEFDVVTDADKESEARIIELIRANFPDHKIVAEESGADTSGEGEFKWIIDPLDGTTNFAHAMPLFAVSIGIEHNGEIIMGAVYNPCARELFYAEKDSGAWLNEESIKVSDISDMGKALLVTGFPYDRSSIDEIIAVFQKLLVRSHGVLRLGSAALDLCYVACGRLEGFWEFWLSPWDTAAGYLILSEAGGKITDFQGNPYSPYTPQILATNDHLHEEILMILRDARVGE